MILAVVVAEASLAKVGKSKCTLAHAHLCLNHELELRLRGDD